MHIQSHTLHILYAWDIECAYACSDMLLCLCMKCTKLLPVLPTLPVHCSIPCLHYAYVLLRISFTIASHTFHSFPHKFCLSLSISLPPSPHYLPSSASHFSSLPPFLCLPLFLTTYFLPLPFSLFSTPLLSTSPSLINAVDNVQLLDETIQHNLLLGMRPKSTHYQQKFDPGKVSGSSRTQSTCWGCGQRECSTAYCPPKSINGGGRGVGGGR